MGQGGALSTSRAQHVASHVMCICDLRACFSWSQAMPLEGESPGRAPGGGARELQEGPGHGSPQLQAGGRRPSGPETHATMSTPR